MSGPTLPAMHHGCDDCQHTKKDHKSMCWAEVWNGEDYGFCACKRYLPRGYWLALRLAHKDSGNTDEAGR